MGPTPEHPWDTEPGREQPKGKSHVGSCKRKKKKHNQKNLFLSKSLGAFGAVWKPSGSGEPRSQTLRAGMGLGAAVWFKDQSCVNQQRGLEIQPSWGLCCPLLLLASVNFAIIQSRALPAARGAKMDRRRWSRSAAA